MCSLIALQEVHLNSVLQTYSCADIDIDQLVRYYYNPSLYYNIGLDLWKFTINQVMPKMNSVVQ